MPSPPSSPDFGELQALVRSWLERYYPAWRSATVRADVGEPESLAMPIPREWASRNERSPVQTTSEHPFIPTQLQVNILEALDGKAMRTDTLARACEVERTRFYKPGGLKDLQELGKVAWHERIGYYRPDSPPEEVAAELDTR